MLAMISHPAWSKTLNELSKCCSVSNNSFSSLLRVFFLKLVCPMHWHSIACLSWQYCFALSQYTDYVRLVKDSAPMIPMSSHEYTYLFVYAIAALSSFLHHIVTWSNICFALQLCYCLFKVWRWRVILPLQPLRHQPTGGRGGYCPLPSLVFLCSYIYL